MISQSELKQILTYNKDTGIFTWVNSGKGRNINKVGNIDSYGYLRIHILGKTYKAHRLAWLYIYGQFPKNLIDHLDGDKSNNKINNLQDVTPLKNSRNKKSHRNGHLLGTSFNKKCKKWSAQIRIHLGYFDSKEEAHKAYLLKCKEFYNEI